MIKENVKKGIGIAGLALMPAVSYVLFESVTGNLAKISPFMALLNICWIAVLYLAAFVLSGRSRIAVPLISILLFALSLGETFVMEFRSRPIMIWDVLAITTAISVTGNYRLDFSPEMIRAGLLLLALNAGLFFCPVRLMGRKKRLAFGGAGAFLIGGFVLTFYGWMVPVWDLCLNMWEISDTYEKEGYMLSTAISLRYMKAEKPAGYSGKKVGEIYERIRLQEPKQSGNPA